MSQADDSGAADGEAVPDYPGLLRLDGGVSAKFPYPMAEEVGDG